MAAIRVSGRDQGKNDWWVGSLRICRCKPLRAGKCDKGAAGDPPSLFMKTSYVIKGYTLGADASDKLVSEQIDQFSRTHARAHTHTQTQS